MAGNAQPGFLPPVETYPPELSLNFFPGTGANASGTGLIFNQWSQDPTTRAPNITDLFPAHISGIRTAATQSTPGVPAAGTARVGSDDFDKCSLNAQDWFEAIHLLPKVKIEFGNIITLVEQTYEIYNAFRRTPETESAIVNNVAPGVVLPDNTPPEILPPQTSLLDPSTTGQTTSALGTIVPSKVQAEQDGLPTFDSDIIFQFLPVANDVTLLLSGSRIALLPFIYEFGTKESLSFLTNVIPSLTGKRQAISVRKQPRQSFQVEYSLEAEDRQEMHAILFDQMGSNFGFPVLDEGLTLTADALANATTFDVSGADEVDIRVGGLCALITDRRVFDVISIDSVTATLITSSNPAINAYPEGTILVPVRTAIIPHRVSLKQFLQHETFKITFDVLDNDTGALTGDVTPGFWSTYGSPARVLFDDCNVINRDSMAGSLSRRIYRIDGGTGVQEITSLWDRNKRQGRKGFHARNRQEIFALRKLFIGLRGRQKAFYLPTFIDEITLNASLSIGSNLMDIEAIGYTRFAQSRAPFNLFRITFTDDTELIRVVQSSAIVTNLVERLTLDTTWPANRALNEISRIEWFELMQFDSDTMVMVRSEPAQVRVEMPVVRVFDDN